jgi:signal transduction histidine kinase
MNWMRRWSWAIAMVVAIVITVGGLVVLESGRERIAREYETALDARTAAGELYALTTQLASSAAAARGYLLTREPGDIDAYGRAFAQAHAIAARLDDYYLKIGDTGARARFASVAATLDAREREIDSIVGLAHAGRLAEAQARARDSAALAAADAQRDTIDTLLANEEQRAQRAIDASRADQRISTLCVGAVSALNIVLFVLLFRNLGTQLGMQSREQERLLNTQTELDRLVRERTRQLEALARHLQNIGEEEKTKLARELHDELGAILTATKIDVASAQRRLVDTDQVAADKLARAQGHLDQGIALKRRIVEDMRPTVLAHFGLVTALRTLAEESAQRNGWQLSLGLPEEDVRLDEALAIALFRVAQESLNNAAKYARARRLSVQLSVPPDLDANFEASTDLSLPPVRGVAAIGTEAASARWDPAAKLNAEAGSITLDIVDDGIGIAPEDLLRARTHGLLGMRQRVAARGGTLDIGPGDGGTGTRVSVRMPVDGQGAAPIG